MRRQSREMHFQQIQPRTIMPCEGDFDQLQSAKKKRAVPQIHLMDHPLAEDFKMHQHGCNS